MFAIRRMEKGVFDLRQRDNGELIFGETFLKRMNTQLSHETWDCRRNFVSSRPSTNNLSNRSMERKIVHASRSSEKRETRDEQGISRTTTKKSLSNPTVLFTPRFTPAHRRQCTQTSEINKV